MKNNFRNVYPGLCHEKGTQIPQHLFSSTFKMKESKAILLFKDFILGTEIMTYCQSPWLLHVNDKDGMIYKTLDQTNENMNFAFFHFEIKE